MDLGGASNDVSAISSSNALVALVLLIVVSSLGARLAHRHVRRIDRPTALWFGGFASLALIASVTLFREGLPTSFSLTALFDWSTDGVRLLSRDPFGSSQFVLNILLFVPAGVTWTWIARRPLRVLVVLTATSLVVESIQGVTGVGANDVADVVANTIGAAIGVGLASIVLTVVVHKAIRMTRRSQWSVVIAVTGVVVLIVTSWLVGASRRQDSVEKALRDRFEGTNRRIVETMISENPESVWRAANDRADGTRRSPEALEIRYPAAFFGLDRCVYVVWIDSGVDFRRESGQACTDFIDG